MHPTSQVILNMIRGSENYTLVTLKQDLFPSEEDEFLTRKQVAGIYKVNIRTVDDWIKRFPEVSLSLRPKVRRIYKNKLHEALQRGEE